MIVKKNLRKMKRVTLWIGGVNGNYFKGGKKSKSYTIYDTTPDEVEKKVLEALEE